MGKSIASILLMFALGVTFLRALGVDPLESVLAVALGVLLYLGKQAQSLRHRVRRLEQAQVEIQNQIWQLTADLSRSVQGEAQPTAPEPTPVEPDREDPVEPNPPPPSTRPSTAEELLIQPRVEPAPPPVDRLPTSLLPTELKHWLLSINPIVKIGIAMLFLGLSFLAKFAAEHIDVSIEWRLSSIGSVALVLLGLGWRLRTRRASYAQALQGGAIAVLYLTLFSAFRFYGVLPVTPAFVLMALVAVLAAALALLQDARALAVLGALGGFATPLLLAGDDGNPVVLFTYYLILDLGIAGVAWYSTWRSLNLIGFFATFIVATSWGVLNYSPERYASSQFFLVTYFLLFDAILLMPVRRNDRPTETIAGRSPQPVIDGSLLFGLPTITLVLQMGLVRPLSPDYGVALSCLALAAFYVLQAWLLRRAIHARLLFEASLAIGTIFLTLVFPFALDASHTGGAWALEGAGLVWLGLRQQRHEPRGLGYLLLFLSGLSLAPLLPQGPPSAGWINAVALNALLVTAGAWLAAHWLHRRANNSQRKLDQPESFFEWGLTGWGLAFLVGVVLAEIHWFVPVAYQEAARLAGLSAIALILLGIANRLDWPEMTWPLPAHALVMAGAAWICGLGNGDPAASGGWLAWMLAFLTHALVLRYATPSWLPAWEHAVHLIGALVLAALSALQGRVITQGWGELSSAWPWLGWLVGPALLLGLVVHPKAMQYWPMRACPQAYQGHAGALLSLTALVWTLLANAFSEGSATPLPHLPLLNPLDLGIGAAGVATLLWMRTVAAQDLLQDRMPLAWSALALSGFVWLNAILVRAFHHWGGVPFHVRDWMASLAVQTGLTLLWSSMALVLMWLSAHRSLRKPWLIGAGLLGAVVLKLLLIDLSGSGTITRIISFIGVGVLMLVIGYVAPLPGASPSPSSQPTPDTPDASR